MESITASAELFGDLAEFLARGGAALWVIAALSVLTLAVILWKAWQLLRAGAWSISKAERAVALFTAGNAPAAQSLLARRRGLRVSLARAAIAARRTRPDGPAREETARVAKGLLAEVRGGLRVLELIASIAPLLGLLGTVLGMIAAFQALQESGAGADPAALAGGIWEALLTTAAGMAVAIPAAMALSWYEAVIDRVRHDMEDIATRIFLAPFAVEQGEM